MCGALELWSKFVMQAHLSASGDKRAPGTGRVSACVNGNLCHLYKDKF